MQSYLLLKTGIKHLLLVMVLLGNILMMKSFAGNVPITMKEKLILGAVYVGSNWLHERMDDIMNHLDQYQFSSKVYMIIFHTFCVPCTLSTFFTSDALATSRHGNVNK